MRARFLGVMIGLFSQDNPRPPGAPRKIFETGPPFALDSPMNLGETIYVTPAVLEGRFCVRTGDSLICLGDP